MRREVELKLEFDGVGWKRVAHWLSAKRAKSKTPARTLKSIYFDTPDFLLYRNGISLRIRKNGDAYVQTIKQTSSGSAGLFDRTEWECEVKGFRLDIAAARKTRLKAFQRKELTKSIRRAFEVRVRRATYIIVIGDSELELALDRGKVVKGKRSAPLRELEIELVSGNAKDLFRAARTIDRIAPSRLGVRTKSDRGYELLHGNQKGVYRATSVNLAPHIATEDAFRVIAKDCLRQIVANEPATLELNSEALHQMRVGLRRLRASISAFSEMVRDRGVESLKAEYDWLADHLGEARDLDVLLTEALKRDQNGTQGLPALQRTFQERRQLAYVRVHDALSAPRFRKLILQTLAWIESGRWRIKPGALAKAQRKQAIVAHAAGEVRRRYKKFTKTLADFKDIDPPQRHRLRIRAKKLRYAVEFFGSVFPGKKNVRRHMHLLSALKDLQDALGSLNDIATHEKLMSGVALSAHLDPKQKGAEAFTAGVIYRSEDARSEELLGLANAAGRKIVDADPFWK